MQHAVKTGIIIDCIKIEMLKYGHFDAAGETPEMSTTLRANTDNKTAERTSRVTWISPKTHVKTRLTVETGIKLASSPD